jgi:hypothetical protein
MGIHLGVETRRMKIETHRAHLGVLTRTARVRALTPQELARGQRHRQRIDELRRSGRRIRGQKGKTSK